MKKYIILFIFPLLIFSQVQQGTVVKQVTPVNVNTVHERTKEYSNPNIEIIKSIEIDLNNFTDLLIVNVNLGRLPSNHKSYYLSKDYKEVERNLLSSPLNIWNPHSVNKKKFKKNPRFLKNEKDSKYLYLSIDFSRIMDDVITILTVRDFENNIIYSTKNTNISMSEILFPFINF